MSFRSLAAVALLSCLCAVAAIAQPLAPSIAGTWRLMAARSTDPSPWTAIDLMIGVEGPRVSLTRKYSNGIRAVDTVERLDLSLPVTVVPVPFWAENRDIGANIAGDRTERVRARWLDDGRILRTDADLVLGTQQGDREVNILTDYKLSNSGAELTVIELRSTREIPIVYVFKRIPS